MCVCSEKLLDFVGAWRWQPYVTCAVNEKWLDGFKEFFIRKNKNGVLFAIIYSNGISFTFWNVSNDNKHVIPIERRFENLSERTMLCSHVSMTNWPCLPKRQHHWSAIIGFSCVDGYVLLNTKIAIRIWFSGCNFFCILVIIFSYIRNI